MLEMISSIAVLKCIWIDLEIILLVRAFSDLEKLLYYKQNVIMYLLTYFFGLKYSSSLKHVLVF